MLHTTPLSIILVRLSALGDVLMFVPLVRSLQKNYPKADITWVISRPAYDLVEGMDGIKFIVIDKPKGLRDYYRFYRTLKSQSFDVLFAAQASFRANLLYPLIRAKRKVGYDKNRGKDGHTFFITESISEGRDHTLEGFLKFGECLGLKREPPIWNLPITIEDRDFVKSLKLDRTPYMIINPAASKSERSWLVERYITIAEMMIKKWGLRVVLTGGPGNQDRLFAEQIVKAVPACVDLIGKTKPKQLLALIEQAKVVLCPDTGPSHMAAAVGTPVVALHAVTSAEISGPYGQLHHVVDYYPEALKTFLNLSFGTHRWGTQVHHEHAMALIPIEETLLRLSSILGEPKHA